MPSTNSYATLRNYQNAIIYIDEPRVNLTLINHVISVYKFEHKILGPIGQYWLLQNLNMKLTQYHTIESQLYSSTLYILQPDTKCSSL